MSGRAGGYGKVKGAADAFKRGAMENAARSVMNDIHDMAGIGDAGSRAHGRDSYGTGGDSADTALTNRGKSDPRTQCTPADTFSGGIGTQSTRGYRQSGGSGKNGTKSRFDLKKILKNALFNGLMGGLTDTAFYGMDKAVDAAAVGFLGNQRGSGTQRRIAENGSGSTTPNKGQGFSSKGYNPQTGERILKGYVEQNANPEVALYTKSTGFNNSKGNAGGQFKRLGAEEHYGLSPHVHQPVRNVAPNGTIYGRTGKTVGVDTLLPSRKDVKQLYEYLNNGKYHQ